MIILTKSSKYGEYCVAGIDCADGRWVRLVSDHEDTHGAISDEMLYDQSTSRCAGILDRIEVEIAREVPGPIQPENCLVDGTDKIRILKRSTLKEALEIHPCEERDELFGSHSYMVQVNPESLGHSLEMVQAVNLRVYTAYGKSGKAKRKLDFECGGRKYEQFAVTDPLYYGDREIKIDKAALVLSISDDEWSRANGNYIYVARIFVDSAANAEALPERKKAYRGLRFRKKQLILTGAVVIVMAMAALIFSMGTSYYAPYTGARRHEDMNCQGLGNANAVRSMPTAIAKILFRPCMYCADETE